MVERRNKKVVVRPSFLRHILLNEAGNRFCGIHSLEFNIHLSFSVYQIKHFLKGRNFLALARIKFPQLFKCLLPYISFSVRSTVNRIIMNHHTIAGVQHIHIKLYHIHSELKGLTKRAERILRLVSAGAPMPDFQKFVHIIS